VSDTQGLNASTDRTALAAWLRRVAAACLLTAIFATPLRAQTPPDVEALRKKLDTILTGHGVKGAALGAHVIELPSGRVLYAKGSEKPMIPASNAKLVVIAAAYDALGKDFRFETVLGLRGDDLVVIGGGDPTLGDPKLARARGESTTALFHRWAAALKSAGVTSISGRLLVDDSIFEKRWVHPTWPPGQYQEWYEAPIGGLNFADNCVEVNVAPTQGGAPASVRLSPPNTLMRIVNQTRSNGKQGPSMRRTPNSETITVSGPVARDVLLGEVTVTDPGLFFASAMRTALAARGIRIRGETQRAVLRGAGGALPADLRVVARERTLLADATLRAGRDSLGMMAEGLIKTLGAQQSGTGTWSAGAEAVGRFLVKCGVMQGQYQFADGSGLSRSNRLSAEAATGVLRHMFAHPAAEAFRACLAVSGGEGTLKRRMRDVTGRVIAKTGYIDGVRTLAGYVQTRGGTWLAFAFYYNDASNTSVLSGVQDNACRALVNWGERSGGGGSVAESAPRGAGRGRARRG